jgi:hypothetical protein
MCASRKIKKSKLLSLDGNLQGTRKKPHVIAAALEQDMLVSCWCITVMAIYIIPVCSISEQCVSTVWKKSIALMFPGVVEI